jgi:hypothetical protein
MTESQWTDCKDPEKLLKHLGDKVSERKRRLFACACCRHVWDLLTDERSRHAVEVSEGFADGLATLEELDEASAQAEAARVWGDQQAETWAAWNTASRDLQTLLYWVHYWARVARAGGQESNDKHDKKKWKSEVRAQADLLRDLFGDPFHPLPTRHFPAHVLGLARSCYDGDHALFPVLADALEELGEERAAAHCREKGHVKGCHVLDWLLGKS